MLPDARTRTRVRWIAAFIAAIGLFAASAVAGPAFAADGSLTIAKTVNGEATATLSPGDEFSYSIEVGCDDIDCAGATMTDPLPAQFAGFTILQTSVTPAAQPSSFAYTGCTTTVTAACSLGVAFREAVDGGGIGISAGDTYTVSVTMKVPTTLLPSWPGNGVAVTNTATASATNASTVTSSATATVDIPVTVGTAVGKTWAPASQPFEPGAASTIGLTTANTSDVPAASLTLQDPSVAPAAAAALDAANPFAIVDFAGFGTVTLPQGATTVRVDAYVFDGSTWNWQNGTAASAASIALPVGVTNANVGGLRFTFVGDAGATIDPVGTAGAVPLSVAQRATNRITGASLVSGATDTNVVVGTVAVPGHAAVSKTAQAPFSVSPVAVKVEAAKSITPSNIPAGTSATAVITGKNDGDPVTSLTVSDLNYFTADLAFGGFSSPLSYPSGATSATIDWHFSDGSISTVPFADGASVSTPTPPAGAAITGFVLNYRGSIATNAGASAQFAITPDAAIVSSTTSPLATSNTVTVSGTNAAGTATAAKSAPLNIFFPSIALGIAKSISPASPVSPGGTVVAQLPTTTSTNSAFVTPTSIVVEDEYRPGTANDFWNAFNPIAIAPTQVPDGATLTIEYTTDGTTWQTFTVVDATAGPKLYSGDLPAAAIGSIIGLRYTFSNPDSFGQGTTVSPNAVFQARDTLRSGGAPTSVADAGPSSYTNLAFANAAGSVAGIGVVHSNTPTATAKGAIQTVTGQGTLGANKRWTTPNFASDLTVLSSQSGASAGTLLGWGVGTTGYSSVTVSDPADGEATPAQTTFQAFDLRAIAPRTIGADPLLQWDSVSTVELYFGGQWNTITPPSGGWMSSNGFVGYVLPGAQGAVTTGVRITVVPNDAARAASSNPLAPPPGSGISTSFGASARAFGLVWQLRNTVRVPAAPPASNWVNATHGYNDLDPATIHNTEGVSGVQNGSPVGPVTSTDAVSLLDQPPGVNVVKASSKTSIVVPPAADVDPAAYPTDDFTVTAKNTSTSRASYLRVTDPMPCTAGTLGDCTSAASAWAADPFASAGYAPTTNPFERVTLTGIAFAVNPGQVSQTTSMVTLWHLGAGGALSTTTVTLAAAQALAAANLADVVGVSVVYQGSDPTTSGGTISSGSTLVMTLHTQVRKFLRSDPTTLVTPFQVTNAAFSQSYDPVLYPSGPQSTPIDTASANVNLITGTLGVTASKTISPASFIEANRTTPVTVTLGATQGSQTIATNEVTISDTDPVFWNSFRLTGLNPTEVTLPAGANQVRVDVQLNGSSTWILGVAGATAALPTGVSGELAQVTGVRFVFNRSDGGLFSHSAVPTNWSASAILHVALLDVDRTGATIPFPSTVTDTVNTLSHRYESPTIYPDATASATSSIVLQPGTYSLDVSKSPANGIHTVTPGDPNTWTIDFRNSGTGFLTIDDLVDTIPDTLLWDGEDPAFATSAGGTLPTTGITTSFDQGTGALTFTWPAGARRMAPGEQFTITLGISLQPGLTASERATNQFVVDTAQSLSDCANTSGNEQGVLTGLAATQCGSSNYLQPNPGPSLVITKGVKGDVLGTHGGAINPGNPTRACVANAAGYYRAPCAATSVVGGTDQWQLAAVNSGTVRYSSLTIVDPLPFPGDRLLATGSARGSTYRPVFDGDFGLQLTAPTGTVMTWQVTTAADVCVGTGARSAWTTDPTCSTHPAVSSWVDATAYTGSWAAVTGLRAVLDFAGVSGGSLAPGGAVSVLFRTVNQPVTAADPDFAPTAQSATNAFAWNQTGAVADLVGGGTIARAPVRAGVTLPTGPLQITKAITGPAASFAPTSFTADVDCTVDGAAVDLGANAAVALDSANTFTAILAGIPIGATCAIAEDGVAGSYGEASRSQSASSVTIDSGALAGATPSSQQVTITNDYEFGQLSLAKHAESSTITEDGTVTYDITVANVGPLTASDFSVTDVLPKDSLFVSATGNGTLSNGVVTWPMTRLLPATSTTVTVTLQFLDSGTFVNSATVTNPAGPWSPAQSSDPCPSAAATACAAVEVEPIDPGGELAFTGVVDGILIGLAGVLFVIGGILFTVAGVRRRVRG